MLDITATMSRNIFMGLLFNSAIRECLNLLEISLKETLLAENLFIIKFNFLKRTTLCRMGFFGGAYGWGRGGGMVKIVNPP